jgi:hypothetical protein
MRAGTFKCTGGCHPSSWIFILTVSAALFLFGACTADEHTIDNPWQKWVWKSDPYPGANYELAGHFDDLVFITAYSEVDCLNKIFGLNITDGTLRWHYELILNEQWLQWHYQNVMVVVDNTNRSIRGIDVNSGQLLWEQYGFDYNEATFYRQEERYVYLLKNVEAPMYTAFYRIDLLWGNDELIENFTSSSFNALESIALGEITLADVLYISGNGSPLLAISLDAERRLVVLMDMNTREFLWTSLLPQSLILPAMISSLRLVL